METDALLKALDRPILWIGGEALSLWMALAAGLFLLVLTGFVIAARGRTRMARELEAQGSEAAERMAKLMRSQAEIQGRMQTMAEIFGARQADLTRAIADRLDGMSSRVGQSILDTTKETKASLSALSERLAVIDRAQGRISDLAGEVVRLQDILSNKQTRGAFGEGRMEAIVMDALPQGSYSFQATLSNGRRPDCLIPMPNGAPALVVDAKFPLEAWSAWHKADEEGAKGFAAARFRRDMEGHVRAIAERYLIPGETQDTAFLFVPSESVFGDLHEDFEDVVQRAHRLRVVIVSPSLLMLSIQVVQAILKGARMRREAGHIQAEVRFLMEDIVRLDARVAALKTHFGQTGRDIDQILISTDKIVRRSERIEAVDLGAEQSERTPQPSESLAGE